MTQNCRNKEAVQQVKPAWLIALSLAFTVITGCTTGQNTEPLAQAGENRLWQGRFSITLIDPEGQRSDTLEAHEERAQGRFKLTQIRQNLNLALFSPFGQTLANASSSPQGAQLTTSDGRMFRAADPDILIERALGWKLPVSALPGWLNGEGLASDGTDTTLNNWRVRAEQRFDSGKPRRLAAHWPAVQRANERRINLFLVVDRAP